MRKTISERTLSGAATEGMLADLMDEFRTLDKDTKAFKLIDRPLYHGYIQMRKIIDSGGGSGKEKPKPGVTPGA